MLFGHGSKTLVPSNELVNGCSSPGKKNKPEIVAFRRSFDSAGTGGGFGLKAFSMFHPKLRLQVLRSLSMWHCPRECQQITSQLGSRDSWLQQKTQRQAAFNHWCFYWSMLSMLSIFDRCHVKIQSKNDSDSSANPSYIPSGYVKIAIENGPVEIVDFPINSMVDLSIVM